MSNRTIAIALGGEPDDSATIVSTGIFIAEVSKNR